MAYFQTIEECYKDLVHIGYEKDEVDFSVGEYLQGEVNMESIYIRNTEKLILKFALAEVSVKEAYILKYLIGAKKCLFRIKER